MEVSKCVIFSVIILVLAVGVITSVHAKSSSSTQGKWIQYTDPYGRYTIEYPSKWKIENEPVHSVRNEIPFQVSDFHNGIARRSISVQQIENAGGMNGKEVLSTFQTTLSNYYLSVQPAAPISCIYIKYDTCMLGLVATTDGQSYTPIVAASIKDPQKGTFILSYTDPSSSSSIDFNHVITSFKILVNSAANSIPSCIVPFGNATLTWDDETLCYH